MRPRRKSGTNFANYRQQVIQFKYKRELMLASPGATQHAVYIWTTLGECYSDAAERGIDSRDVSKVVRLSLAWPASCKLTTG